MSEEEQQALHDEASLQMARIEKMYGYEPFTSGNLKKELKKDRPLVLRYRLWIKPGPAPTEKQFRTQWQAYQNAKPQEPTR